MSGTDNVLPIVQVQDRNVHHVGSPAPENYVAAFTGYSIQLGTPEVPAMSAVVDWAEVTEERGGDGEGEDMDGEGETSGAGKAIRRDNTFGGGAPLAVTRTDTFGLSTARDPVPCSSSSSSSAAAAQTLPRSAHAGGGLQRKLTVRHRAASEDDQYRSRAASNPPPVTIDPEQAAAVTKALRDALQSRFALMSPPEGHPEGGGVGQERQWPD
ncbi:hypothetical protein HK104_006569, partial [Borealophlyctis nickersoniae]